MMHLIARTTAAPTQRVLLPLSNGMTPRSPRRLNSVFCSRAANFLEKRDGGLHYSVINRYATTVLASGYAGRDPLNDDVSASRSRTGYSGAQAQVGGERRCNPVGPVAISNRRKKDLCRRLRFCSQNASLCDGRERRNDANRRKHSRDASPIRYGCHHLTKIGAQGSDRPEHHP